MSEPTLPRREPAAMPALPVIKLFAWTRWLIIAAALLLAAVLLG